MGVISILLGIIAFFCFTGVGALLANTLVDYKTLLSMSFTALAKTSNAAFIAIIVGVFAFIGLLIGMNLVMHGINYGKLCKIQKRIRSRQ